MRLWLNRVLDFLLWVFLCLMLATGLIMRYRLPPGSRGGAGLSMGSWSRHDWGDLHAWLGFADCLMVVLHLALNWRWLWHCAVPRWRWSVVVGLLAGILLALSAWVLPVERADGNNHRGEGRGQGLGGGWGSERSE